MEESTKVLSECQSLVDSLWRDEVCGESLRLEMAEIRYAHQSLLSFYENERTVLLELVKNATQGWNHCLFVYQKIYTMSAKLPSLKKSFPEEIGPVPLDVSSALNVVEIHGVTIRLYNDNESLFKYEPSELLGYGEEITMVESYWESECKEMWVLLEKFLFLHEPAKMSRTQMEKRECFLRRVRSLVNETECKSLKEELERLIETINKIEQTWLEERINTKTYVDNLLAKWMESVRLVDNLFRSYHLTVTRKRTLEIKSIF